VQFTNFQEKKINSTIISNIRKFSFGLTFLAVCTIVFDVGFSHDSDTEYYILLFYSAVLFIGSVLILTRYFLVHEKFPAQVRIFDGLIFLLYFLLLLARIDGVRETMPFMDIFNRMGWLYLAIFIYFIREFAIIRLNFKREYLNPAQLFIGSFLLLILMGTLLLMLPTATYTEISLLDALFTSTSAVCVTGLIVVDTGTFFTPFGQTLIMILIQLGGLGIMTFASYFSYFFRGKSSYESQLLMKDITNAEKIGEVFSVLKKIIILTFLIELVGAIFVFFTLDPSLFDDTSDEIFFSFFHAVSGFCNAGFSTLEQGLYEPEFSFNYPLQLILAALFIFGGIGFPILLNLYKFLIYFVRNRIGQLKRNYTYVHNPWVVNINSRIVLTTTILLLIFGTVLFYFAEYNNTLAPHSGFGKVVTAFFSAATPRTAGFNSIDTSALHFSTVMLVILLMWIGASPASTGGGIKTSTFALATLNFFSLARGKDRIEVYRREVADISIRRAFAIMSLSLVVIGASVAGMAYFDNEKDLMDIAFEAFSAYSTVGLSLGITAALSAPSKMIIIATMFIGRVSMLTILIALLRKVKHLNYKYPTEEILMN